MAEFRREFDAARKLGSEDQMAQIVKRYQREAVDRVQEVCTDISNGTSEELEQEIAALSRAWKTSMHSGFVNKYYEYLSLIAPPERRERERLTYEYDNAVRQYFENLESKDGPTFELLADKFQAFAKGYAGVGDHLMSAMAWRNYAYCYTDDLRDRKQRDPRKVLEAFGKAIEEMDRIELDYVTYQEMKGLYQELVDAGWKDAIDNPDAAPPGQPAPKGDPIPVAMTFEAIPKLTSFERPNYMLDELYEMWESLYFANKDGAEATIHSIEGGPRLVRNQAASIDLYADADDKPDGEIKITGKIALVETELQEGGQRGWAFMATTGIEQDTYQGLQLNLAPSDGALSLYYFPAGSVVGTVGETEVRVIDDNVDGIYGSDATSWQFSGLSSERGHTTTDSMVIGDKEKRALPWSRYQKIGAEWYSLASEEGGTKLVATPVDVQTGSLVLKYKGPTPSWVVVAGDEFLEGAYFDLMQNGRGKPVEVPVGVYHLVVGELRKGKKAQTMKALMIPGDETPEWTVAEGKETVVELGEPFDFDFKYTASGSEVTVPGKTVAVIGVSQERYERTWNCVPEPAVSVRAAGEKRGSKPEEMGRVLDLLEEENGVAKYGFEDTWHPLTCTVEVRGTNVQVQLLEKKNKLFGKIESTWR